MYLCSKKEDEIMTFTQSPLLNILIIVLIALAIIIGFNLANIYYLKKMNVNKWILFAIAFVSFAISFVLSIYYPTSPWQIPAPGGVPVYLPVVYGSTAAARQVDKNAKPVVMKPKAKPSRAKKPLAEARWNQRSARNRHRPIAAPNPGRNHQK